MLRGRRTGAGVPPFRRALAFIGVVAALVGGSVVGVATPVAPASALSGSDFNAGMIISDALFYDGNAMSQAEIQAFLDARVGSCLNAKCLNVGTVDYPGRPLDVSSRTGNKVCDAIAGGSMRVSELIYRVQVACGISAKVILVTLQKEQGLITNRAPTDNALSKAMGMACPDTAPCDPGYLGLARQIATGTAQLKCYKACAFAKQPGVQYIQYHPTASCGGTSVYVQNYATAALYSYTPYQPNAASLANLGTTGDGCSSYGNRNFWYFYSNWFGSTGGGGEGPGAVAINQAWEAQGGKSGPWGNRVQYMDCRNGVECGHVFENVIVGWTFNGGIKTATGSIMQWVVSQGVSNVGYPDSDVVPVAGGSQQSFSRGLVNVAPTGTFLVSGATRTEHGRLGGVAAAPGWPTSAKSCTFAGGACLQTFEHAYISEVGGTAFSLIDLQMLAYFSANGGAATLGVPNTQLVAVTGPNGTGTQQSFQSALVAAGPLGVFSMKSAIRSAHAGAGGVNASIGWPTAEQTCDATACSQTFQNGLIYASTNGTSRVISGPIAAYYASKGGVAGALGAPLSDVVSSTASGGGLQMAFAGGLVESSTAGTFLLTGAIRDSHGRQGGVAGPLGWPIAEQVCGLPDGGCSQAFQNGTLFATPKSGMAGAVTHPAIAAYYTSKGGPAGALGYPVTATIEVAASGGGAQVAFQGGLVESSTAGTFLLTGAIREAHGRQGGVAGPLGWPIAEQVCGLPEGGCSQAFQRGTLFSTTKGGLSGGVSNAAIAAYYQSKGGPAGVLGYPVTGTFDVTASGGGAQVAFQGGLVETSPAGTFLLTGAIRDAHGRQGGVAGPLGWPTAEQVCGLPGGGCSQTFQNGTLFASPNGAAGSVSDPAIAAYYQSNGGPGGTLGYPITGTIPVVASGGGAQVAFQGGLVETSPAGTFVLTGAIRDAHGRQGGVAGPLGWPTAEQACGLPDGGCTQIFQNGTLFASPTGASGSVADPNISAYYLNAGGPTGSLGYPLTGTITVPASANGGGVQVAFQGGLVESSPAGTFLLSGAIREAHGAQGGVAGPLGWPTAEQVCGLPDGACSQTFQYGTLVRSSRAR